MSVSWGHRLLASVLSALASAGLVHLTMLLAFWISDSSNAAIIGAAHQYFLSGTLISFVVVFAFGVFGLLGRWWGALVAGIVAGLVAPLAGTSFQVLTQGIAIDETFVPSVASTLLTVNFGFLVTTIAVVPTVGRLVYRSLVGAQSSTTADARVALVRLPAKNLTDGQVTHIDRSPIDTDLADRQWDAYVAAFAEHGWTTQEVPYAERLADSVFVEDAVVVIGGLAVIARSGSEERRGETDGVEEVLAARRYPIERIMSPGTLDGGDVLVVGTTVYVGRSSRTNADGIAQLRALLGARGFDVVAVPVTRALHLKSTVTALPDGTVIGHDELVDEPRLFGRYLPVPEKEGVAVVALDEETLLMSEAAPETAELLRELGYDVVTVDISEFEKLEGCVTCLSVRLS
ncbi:dimethylargininase [Labedella gwakjiensis]|uniref:Dimethylargininase n=1 Tax=Labedella gwakjiensis TaxID=390269 RepID=A0A2P8GRV2_9MICO|nr:dimethylargininase [Labedella gwakjiensis]PSL36674.1 dimethylargininase [Labedella gwakjiensis]RUQ84195.1 dimethylarginine dimethylaminohydrolase [Labedella gwakjiensis]